MEGLRGWLRDVVPPVALIVAVDLAVTVAFFGMSLSPARIGTLRPLGTIPPKVLELVLVGGGAGLAACAGARRLDLSLLGLAIAFVALLDTQDPLIYAYCLGQAPVPEHLAALIERIAGPPLDGPPPAGRQPAGQLAGTFFRRPSMDFRTRDFLTNLASRRLN